MLDAETLSLLRCPETHQTLRPADPQLLTRLNQEIAAGNLKNRAGHLLERPLENGLVRADTKVLYPIRHNIPVMLVDEAIPLTDELLKPTAL